MDKSTIGRLINYERTKRKISLRDLSEGVCSVSTIQRIESGEQLSDIFVLERIIERLGKSINKIELFYNENAYEIYYLRKLIEKCLGERNYNEVEDMLAYYETLKEAQKSIHKQYIWKIKAVLLSENLKRHEEAAELLERALKETVPKFASMDLDDCLLGEEELLILLMWMQEKMEINDSVNELDVKHVLSYIEHICQDEEVQVNVLSKATWVLGSLAMKRNNLQEALWYTLQGEKVLAENTVLVHMPRFLDRILWLTQYLDKEAYKNWKKQRDALKSLYEEYNESWDVDAIVLWKNYRQQEVYLISEMFSQGRKLMNQSQEKVADELGIDQKTISRIESGKYKPKDGTFQKLRGYFQIDREICGTRIIVDDFGLLELEREVVKLSSDWRDEEAEVLYKKLKAQLSMVWKENQQYVAYMDMLFDRQLKRISDEEAIKRCEIAFAITKKGIAYDEIDDVVLNRMETLILIYISICNRRMGNKEKAIELLERIIKLYEKSKVDLIFHYSVISIICANLADLYEEIDEFDDSIQWSNRTIEFDLKCKRGINIGYAISEKTYALDRKRRSNIDSKKSYMQAYQINKLMRLRGKMISLKKAYMKWYGEEID